MARKLDKQKALLMRAKGMSYSQIKEKLGVSKSTLSGWLYKMPLSEKRIKELRDNNPIRIERYRNTMRAKRERRLLEHYSVVKKDIGKFSKRDIFIAGLFLYWGEGGKTFNGNTALSNTDPSVLIFFIKWLEILGLPHSKLKARLHLYADMKVNIAIKYWSDILDIPVKSFTKSYIKKSNLSGLTYKHGFGHGTCMVTVANKQLNDYILMGIKRIQDMY